MIYGLKNSLFIEQPSVQQRQFAQLDEEKRIHMEKTEFKKLLKASSEGKPSGDATGVAEKSKFKRNRAKVIFTVISFLGYSLYEHVYYSIIIKLAPSTF